MVLGAFYFCSPPVSLAICQVVFSLHLELVLSLLLPSVLLLLVALLALVTGVLRGLQALKSEGCSLDTVLGVPRHLQQTFVVDVGPVDKLSAHLIVGPQDENGGLTKRGTTLPCLIVGLSTFCISHSLQECCSCILTTHVLGSLADLPRLRGTAVTITQGDAHQFLTLGQGCVDVTCEMFRVSLTNRFPPCLSPLTLRCSPVPSLHWLLQQGWPCVTPARTSDEPPRSTLAGCA